MYGWVVHYLFTVAYLHRSVGTQVPVFTSLWWTMIYFWRMTLPARPFFLSTPYQASLGRRFLDSPPSPLSACLSHNHREESVSKILISYHCTNNISYNFWGHLAFFHFFNLLRIAFLLALQTLVPRILLMLWESGTMTRTLRSLSKSDATLRRNHKSEIKA